MSMVVSAVNPQVLKRMLVWGAGVSDFEEHHAADALFLAQRWCEQGVNLNPDDLFLLALVMAFILWVDDRSDRNLEAPDPVIDWDALLTFVDTGDQVKPGVTPEMDFFLRLSTALEGRANLKEEHVWWRTAAARMLRAMRLEEQTSRSGASPSYAECLEIGAYSLGTETTFTAAYLIYELNRPARYADSWLVSMERYMCVLQRLCNDLRSVEKERREGAKGRTSNTVLVVESILPGREAHDFVEAQKCGYYRLIDQCFERLQLDDPFSGIIRNMRNSIERWYEQKPARYEV